MAAQSTQPVDTTSTAPPAQAPARAPLPAAGLPPAPVSYPAQQWQQQGGSAAPPAPGGLAYVPAPGPVVGPPSLRYPYPVGSPQPAKPDMSTMMMMMMMMSMMNGDSAT